MPDRLTILFQNTTVPTQAVDATSHIAGWSESHYCNTSLVAGSSQVNNVLNKRAAVLPRSAAIVGYRIGKYSIVGNKLIPQGSSTSKVLYVGNTLYATDVPGTSLMMSASSAGAPNGSRFAFRSIPDQFCTGGEWNPDSAFKGAITSLGTALKTGYGFLGRNLGAVSGAIKSIAGGVVSFVPTSMPAFAANEWVRFYRARDDNGFPISGAFRILAVDFALSKITLAGFDVNIVSNNATGVMRLDQIVFYPYTGVEVSRIVSRKVGRPFESYRGRRSSRH